MKSKDIITAGVNRMITNGETPVAGIPATYVKFRFRNPFNGQSTAGLVVPFHEMKHKSISDLSRLFPYSEANKMRTVDVSPEYSTWEQAFNHQF